MTPNELKNKIDSFSPLYSKVMSYERRINFLGVSDPYRVPSDSDYYLELWNQRLNNKASYNNFKRYYSNPNVATTTISKIWDINSVVFNANDRLLVYSEKKESDKSVEFDIWEWWKGEGWDAYKDSPNSLGLVKYNEFGEVTISTVRFKSIKFFEDDSDGNVVEFAYEGEDGLIWVLSGDGIQSFSYLNGIYYEESAMAKYWGDQFPAFHISSKKANSCSELRVNHIVSLYPDIADFLFLSVLGKTNIPFAYSNIKERLRISTACNYSDPSRGANCQGGYLHDTKTGDPLISPDANNALVRCPKCNDSLEIGGEVNINYATIGDSKQPLEYTRFVTPDVKALEFTKKDEKEKTNYLISSGTGKDLDSDQSSLLNSEISVLRVTESQTSTLNKIKDDLVKGVETSAIAAAELTFGDNYSSTSVSMGSRYLLENAETLLKKRELAEAQGLTEALRIDEQLIEQEYSGRESEKRRALVIMKLNNLIGKEATKEAVARYELDKGEIASIDKAVMVIVKEIYTSVLAKEAGDNLEGGSEVSQEQKEAQANLRGSVGGVQGLLEVKNSVAAGITDFESAIEILNEIYGFSREKAKLILGKYEKSTSTSSTQNAIEKPSPEIE